MKIALTVWDEWISPVFDVCRDALVLEIDTGDIISTSKVDLNTATLLHSDVYRPHLKGNSGSEVRSLLADSRSGERRRPSLLETIRAIGEQGRNAIF